MDMQYRRAPTNIIPPPPPEFAEEFVRGGWRRVERLYGARTDMLVKWVEMSGGAALFAQRKEHLRGGDANKGRSERKGKGR